MLDRYGDIEKFITDIDELEMDKDGGVYISEEENYGIIVDLEEQMECFEELKPAIVEVAKHICELDNMAQRYYRKNCNNGDLEDYLVLVYIDEPNIITFTYWGARVNTEYLVVFEQKDDGFVLKQFGNKIIPADWDKE